MLKLRKNLLIYKIKNLFDEQLIILFFHYNTIDVKTSCEIKRKLAKIKNIKIIKLKNKLVFFGFKCYEIQNDKKQDLLYHFNDLNALFTSEADKLSVDQNKNLKIDTSILNLSKLSSENICFTDDFRENFNKKNQTVHEKLYSNFLTIFQGPTLILSCKSIEDIPFVFKVLEQYKNIMFLGGKVQNNYITHLDLKKIISSNITNEKLINLIPYLLRQFYFKLLFFKVYKLFIIKAINDFYITKIISLILILNQLSKLSNKKNQK